MHTAACFALHQILPPGQRRPAEPPFVMLFHLAWVGATVMTLMVPFY